MTRREARELIMKMLYEMSFQPEKDKEQVINYHLTDVKGKVRTFIIDEFKGILDHQEEIDQIIKNSLENWSVERIAKVDHILLRMGTYEIKFVEEVPNKVAINEAIELAKVYSTDKSPAFINGILGNIVTSIEG